jgi:[ribosomal protein S5]-alanine N-acetyltransferase
MKLITERLILREMRKSDLEANVRIMKDRDVAHMLGYVPFPFTKKKAQEFNKRLEKQNKAKPKVRYCFTITVKGNDEMIGLVNLTDINRFHGVGYIGYLVAKPHWNKGIATEAANAVIDFAFNKLKLRRLNSSAFKDNPASLKVLHKLGFKEEGLSRQSAKSTVTKQVHDEVHLGLLKEEWKSA